jgi:hypothetical protein
VGPLHISLSATDQVTPAPALLELLRLIRPDAHVRPGLARQPGWYMIVLDLHICREHAYLHRRKSS